MLKLFVFNEFSPNFGDGLAFAIAESEDEAKKMIADSRGDSIIDVPFGPVQELPIEKSWTGPNCVWVNGSA